MTSDHKYKVVTAVILFLLGLAGSVSAQEDLLKRYHSTKVSIADIQYSGLNKTKIAVVEREMQIIKGATYSGSALEHARERSIAQLKNLNLFNAIDITFEILEGDTSSVQMNCMVEVVEKWYLWPIPFVEFADRNFNQWWQFDLNPQRTNFGLYLFKYNFRGLNQTVKISLVTGYTHNLGIQYNVPFTSWNKRVGYYLEAQYRTNDEVWYKTEGNKLQFLKHQDNVLIKRRYGAGSIYYRISPTTTVYLDASYGRVNVNDTVVQPEQNPLFLLNGKTRQDQFSSGISIVKEARNNRLFPWSGHYLALYSSSMMINDQRTILNYLGGKAAIYHPVQKNISISGSAIFKVTSLREAPYYNFKSFGYSNYVRGYENYVIEGQHFILLKSGVRYAILNEKENFVPFIPFKQYQHLPVSIYLDAFIDAGYVVNKSGRDGNDLQNTWLYGEGIGLNMAFYFDKVIRFELTRNHLDQYGIFVHFEKSF